MEISLSCHSPKEKVSLPGGWRSIENTSLSNRNQQITERLGGQVLNPLNVVPLIIGNMVVPLGWYPSHYIRCTSRPKGTTISHMNSFWPGGQVLMPGRMDASKNCGGSNEMGNGQLQSLRTRDGCFNRTKPDHELSNDEKGNVNHSLLKREPSSKKREQYLQNDLYK